jgi:3-oxoacyl-[acyl-carrier protein] reductase
MQDLRDQVAVVTGGARGVGRGIAGVLAAEGAHVVVADLDAAAAEAAAAELLAAGHAARGVGVDVCDRAAVGAAINAVVGTLGRVDILAANAGVYPEAPIADGDDAHWDRVMAINVKGAVHAMQAVLPTMRARRYGRIVLTSSITGPITGQPGFGAYGASKAAMLGMMRSAALEVATEGITVNAVMPGNVRTEGFDGLGPDHERRMLAAIPMNRLASPEDIGFAVRMLAAAEAGYITGQTLIVDGGQVLPEGMP